MGACMGNRFTAKDFIFLVIMLALLTLIVLTLGQYNYQGGQIVSLRKSIQTLSQQQEIEIQLLRKISAGGLSIGRATPAPAAANIRKTLANGDRYVYFPNPPLSPHNPYSRPDYAPGDWLVLNLDSEPNRIMPYVPQSLAAMDVQSWVLESLLTRNPRTLKFDPWLAKWYRVSKNGLKITFRIRRRAKFSTGRPVTAEDVVFSYNTIMNPGINCAPIRSYFNDVKTCSAVGRRTVVFTFKRPYFKSLEEVGGMQIIPESVYKFKKPGDFNHNGRTLVGSGPYILKSWTPGQSIVLERNAYDWGPPPTFNQIVLRFIQNPQAALQAFLAGQIDVDGLEPSQWKQYTGQPGFKKKYICYKYMLPTSGYGYIGWNLRQPWFKDRDTRTALAMLVNQPAMIKTFLYGMAQQVTGPFNPLSPQNNPAIKPLPYDPAAAEKLLARAGWKMGPDGVLVRHGVTFHFSLTIPSQFPLGQRMAEYIKSAFARAGVDMTVQPLDFASMTSNLNHRKFDAVMISWSGGIEQDPYQIFDSASFANEGSNAGDYDSPEADRLISMGRREMNLKKRMAIWHKLQAVIYRDQPYMFMFTFDSLSVINHRFRNTRPYRMLGLSEGDWYVPLADQKYH